MEQNLKELKLVAGDLADPANTRKIGKLLTADVVLVGEVTRSGTRTRVKLRLIEITTWTVIAATNHVLGETSPALTGAAAGKPVLILSTNPDHQKLLADAGIRCELKARLPQDPDGYRAVWFCEPAVASPVIGELLLRYVEAGGGLVVADDLPSRLQPRFNKSTPKPWMGIRRVAGIRHSPETRRSEGPVAVLGVLLNNYPFSDLFP